jgi:hypothetical protein
VLTNAAGAGGYVGAVRRKLVELLFDANEEAEKQLAFGINQLDEVMKKRFSEITMQPDEAFVEPLVGAGTTSGLGEYESSATATDTSSTQANGSPRWASTQIAPVRAESSSKVRLLPD